RLATMRGAEVIPEIGSVTTPLDDRWDVHFGINDDAFNGVIDPTNAAQQDLLGLGPRIVDICNRGGRTAEDTWRILGHGNFPPTYTGTRGASQGFQTYFDSFNQGKRVGNDKFRPGAKISGHDVGGQRKYAKGARGKDETASTGLGGLQYGTRWSKTALEFALSSGRGKIHFHLDG